MATVAILTSSTLGTFYNKALRRTVVPHLHREVRGSQQRRYCREVHVVRFTHDPFDDRHRSRLKLVHHHVSYPSKECLAWSRTNMEPISCEEKARLDQADAASQRMAKKKRTELFGGRYSL